MTIYPWDVSGGVTNPNQYLDLLRRVVQLEGDSTWANFRQEWQPIVLAIVTEAGTGDDVLVKVALVDETQESSQYPGFEEIDGWEGKAFNLGGWKLRVDNLVVGMPINLAETTDDGAPWLAVVPMPVRGSITSYAAMSGEVDRWEYTVYTASGSVNDCTNERENNNDATTYQGYARSIFPGSFTVKPIAVGEEVVLHGGSFDVPNLVVCSAG